MKFFEQAYRDAVAVRKEKERAREKQRAHLATIEARMLVKRIRETEVPAAVERGKSWIEVPVKTVLAESKGQISKEYKEIVIAWIESEGGEAKTNFGVSGPTLTIRFGGETYTIERLEIDRVPGSTSRMRRLLITRCGACAIVTDLVTWAQLRVGSDYDLRIGHDRRKGMVLLAIVKDHDR